ncbi:transposase [Enterobacter asburiae]
MVETQDNTEWLAQEVDESSFNNRRLGQRIRELMENFWKNIGSTTPFACQDWAGTKVAYRFLSNPHVDESAILQGHFESTRQRVATLKNETILLLQDTTIFIYQRDNPDIIGCTGTTSAWGKRKDKSKGRIVNCGIHRTETGVKLDFYRVVKIRHNQPINPKGRHLPVRYLP